MSDYDCVRCFDEARKEDPTIVFGRKMIVCPECGDKRCPRAQDHDAFCTTPHAMTSPPHEIVERARAYFGIHNDFALPATVQESVGALAALLTEERTKALSECEAIAENYKAASTGIGALYDAGIRQGASWIVTHIRALNPARGEEGTEDDRG